MKQVVQEVLKGNKTIVSRRTSSVSDKKDPSLDQINRPNYQRLKQEKRLAYQKQGSTPNRQNKIKRQATGLLKNQFNEESISKLNSLKLAQGNIPIKHTNQMQQQQSRIVGKTKNGGCIWFFPKLPEALLGSFHRSINNVAVGTIKMPTCLPNYLLLINEVIRNNQDIKFYIAWDKEGKTPFIAELYDEDEKRLEKIMHDIYQKLNRRALKQHEIYTTVSPGSWLLSQLMINSSVEAVAFLEGVPYYTSIVLMDRLLKNYACTDVDFEINNNYLLLTGNYHVISKLIKELKKEAAGLT